MKQGSWKIALALAFCKHSKVGEYLNSSKNALSNLTGRDKGSHIKKQQKNNHMAREGSADTAKGVQQVQSREYSSRFLRP